MKYTQLPLFNRPTFNTVKILKENMRVTAGLCHLSREEIVDQMNDLADRYGVSLVSNGRLRLDTFEKWINPNDLSRQMPMKALPVFCAVVMDYSALDVLARPVGAKVIGPEDRNLLKWARAYFSARDARREMRRIETGLEAQ